jgi:hypothetical protein
MPEHLQKKNGCINVNNSEKEIDHCFIHACECSYKLEKEPTMKDPQRISKYAVRHYNYEGLNFPVQITRQNIEHFEKLNQVNVNIFHYEIKPIPTTRIEPNLISRQKFEKTINLLVLIKQEESEIIHHFVYIKNFSRLLGTDVKNGERTKHICYHCLYCTDSAEMLKQHTDMGVCEDNPDARCKMPKQGTTLHFKNHQNKLDTPFYASADLESVLEIIQNDVNTKKDQSWTKNLQKHNACMASFKLVCTVDPSLSKPLKLWTGTPDEVMTNLVQYMDTVADECTNIYKPLIMTKDNWKLFKESKVCHLCGCYEDPTKDAKPLVGENKVKDHCHITGNFRGAAHSYCNLQAKNQKKLPVYFHGCKHYDMHFIVPYLNQIKREDTKIDAVPNNEEQYMSLSFNNVQIKDSYQMMASSLDCLVKNLSSNGTDFSKFNQMREEFGDNTELLCRKGVMCYSYVDSLDRLKETKLPEKKYFRDDMNQKDCSDENYQFAEKVWEVFNCQCLGDYYKLYLSTDVLLLADVLDNFRKLCMKTYDLCPLHYLTLPSYSWDAMLKYTKVKPELLSDQNMYMFFEQSIRGGMSVAINKLAYANNPYMGDKFDKTKDTTYLLDLDANSLYAGAMITKLPYSGFNWMEGNSKSLQEWDTMIRKMPDDYDMGMTLEVDVDYPEHLHDDHSDYPFMPETMLIQPEMLSETQKEIYRKQHATNDKPNPKMRLGTVKKLVPNLMHKKNYIIHYRALKQALQHGLVLKKVHRGISYHQKAWIEPYIIKNTKLRAESKDEFEKDLFKFIMNAIFGKTMENVRKRIDFEIVVSDKRFIKVISDPRFHGNGKWFAQDVVGLHRVKTSVKLDKPIYAGATILDDSKVIMYSFHYDVMKPKYGSNVKLMGTDTDSLKYLIKTDDIYKDMLSMKEHFDFCDYPKDHKIFEGLSDDVIVDIKEKNKKVVKKFKDEMNGNIMTQIALLRSKVYAQNTNNECKKRCKGVKKNVVKNNLTFEDYENAVINDTVSYRQMTTFRSYHHQVYTQTMNKIALSSFDDKRFVLPNRVDCRALGHWRNFTSTEQ